MKFSKKLICILALIIMPNINAAPSSPLPTPLYIPIGHGSKMVTIPAKQITYTVNSDPFFEVTQSIGTQYELTAELFGRTIRTSNLNLTFEYQIKWKKDYASINIKADMLPVQIIETLQQAFNYKIPVNFKIIQL